MKKRSFVNDDKNFHRKVFEGMRSANIGVQLHYSPVHLQPFYQNFGFSEGDFPNAELFAKQMLSLPIYPDLKLEEINYIVSSIKLFFEEKNF